MAQSESTYYPRIYPVTLCSDTLVIIMEDLAWPVDGPNSMDLTSMKRSLHMHQQWTDTYAQRVQQEAEIYVATSCMAASQSMQEALTKFRAKCEFLEKAYAQLIAMDAASFERYKEGEDFDRFFRRVLALGKESEAHTFDETAGNIMVLCAEPGPTGGTERAGRCCSSRG